MLFSTRSAIASIGDVSSILSEISEGRRGEKGDEVDLDLVLNQIQNIVVQGAVLSRYFWPIKSDHNTRGAQLREAFQISKGSPLQSRNLRNAIEHFDERLDTYLCADSVTGIVLPQYVGESIGFDPVPNHLFRAYFVDTGEFRILDEQYEIPPIAEEITRVHDLLKKSRDSGGRLLGS